MRDEIRGQIARYCELLHTWNASYEEYAKSVGFSYTSLSLLEAIYEEPNCTQKQLAEICFLPKQTVNAVITSFLKKGWVTLEELPEDRRNKAVNLTEAGAAKAAETITKIHESEHRAMSSLTEEQRRALLELTKTYITRCQQETKNE